VTQHKVLRIVALPALWIIVLAFSAATATAEKVKVEGMIKQRHGDTMILRTQDSADVVVQLTDKTEVGQVEGLFKSRRKQMSMAALIPGLNVKVEGTLGDNNQLIASLVKFEGDEDRANNVTNILLQQGHLPLTRMLAPAAMGESRQIGKDKTAEAEAENRRVVVRVLQNKAVAGI
jgi:flagellar motor protein MotB